MLLLMRLFEYKNSNCVPPRKKLAHPEENHCYTNGKFAVKSLIFGCRTKRFLSYENVYETPPLMTRQAALTFLSNKTKIAF